MKNPHLVSEMLMTDGWAEAKKQITIHRDAALLQLSNVARPKEMPDDVLRGYINGLNWVLALEARAARAIADAAADKKATAEEDRSVGSPMVAEPTTE